MTISEPKRYCYIDWLRGLAILMVFLFHNARFFNEEDWHVKNAETSQGFTIFITFTAQWLMPLDSRLISSIEKHRIISLISAIIVFIILYRCTLSSAGQQFLDSPPGSIARVLHAWFWLAAMMGFAHKYLTSTNRFLRYANEAVLPFYILHQTIILAIGYYIVQLEIPIFIKYVMVTILSFTTTAALYEPLIRRFNILRFLFGMRLKRTSV